MSERFQHFLDQGEPLLLGDAVQQPHNLLGAPLRSAEVILHHLQHIADDGGSIADRRHADRDAGDAQHLLGQPTALVADPRAGMDADIGNLDRRVDPLQRTGSQSINRDNGVWLRPVHDALDDFARLDSG
ncbi:hypothetical protein D3C71_1268360 [compost metagenome]